jgi:hypothetical protein
MYRLAQLVILVVALDVVAGASIAFVGAPRRVEPQTRVFSSRLGRLSGRYEPPRSGVVLEPVGGTDGGLAAIRVWQAEFVDGIDTPV